MWLCRRPIRTVRRRRTRPQPVPAQKSASPHIYIIKKFPSHPLRGPDAWVPPIWRNIELLTLRGDPTQTSAQTRPQGPENVSFERAPLAASTPARHRRPLLQHQKPRSPKSPSISCDLASAPMITNRPETQTPSTSPSAHAVTSPTTTARPFFTARSRARPFLP